ncbi:MAG: hypothetical protein O3A92_16100 [Verrucomicrobia bacterium]|nr:hypothetical protein [Verrucomicrobiota bacterium]
MTPRRKGKLGLPRKSPYLVLDLPGCKTPDDQPQTITFNNNFPGNLNKNFPGNL